MQFKWRLYLSILYWVIGISLILCSDYIVWYSKLEELALIPNLLLLFLAYPISHILCLLGALASKMVQLSISDNLVGYAMPWIILTAGYCQWFYYFPWIYRKLIERYRQD